MESFAALISFMDLTCGVFRDYSLAGLSLYLRLLRGILRGGAMAISEPMSADEIRASVFENDASANAHEHGFADLKRVIDINEGLPEDVRDKDLRYLLFRSQ